MDATAEYTYDACHNSALNAIAMILELVEYTINRQMTCINDCCICIKYIVREGNYIDVCRKHLQFESRASGEIFAHSPKLGFWPRCQGIISYHMILTSLLRIFQFCLRTSQLP